MAEFLLLFAEVLEDLGKIFHESSSLEEIGEGAGIMSTFQSGRNLKSVAQPLKPALGANVVGPAIRRLRRAARPRITHMDLIARLEILGVPISEPALSKIENQQRAVLDYEVRAFAVALSVPMEKLYP
jgi:hypothetical protein